MRLRGQVLRSVFLFAIVGLVGPLLRWLSWPPSSDELSSSGSAAFIYSLTVLLWPTQLIAMVDPSNERLGVAAAAVLANVAWLVALGCAAGFAKRPRHLAVLYVSWAVLFGWASRYLIGQPFSNLLPFLTAFAIYALPFLVLAAGLGDSSTASQTPPAESAAGAGLKTSV